MNSHHYCLDFHLILEKLSHYAFSSAARTTLLSLEPSMDEGACERAMNETTAAKQMLVQFGTPPLAAMESLAESIHLAQAGGMLTIEQLEEAARFCVCCRRLSAYLLRGRDAENLLSAYAVAFEPLDDLEQHIDDSILHGAIRDDASVQLKRIRHSIFGTESRIKDKLQQILQTRKSMLSDGYFVQRSGRYVLPVKKQYQGQFGGTVIDSSRTGGTVFMEPHSIAALQGELDQLTLEEELEVNRILYTLSDDIAAHAAALQSNAARMTELDVLFAKAQLSESMNANPISIGCNRKIELHTARHPLLDVNNCVPLTLNTAEDCRGIIITGPNTGGKTVALKTVGLLTLMAQSGLHIPCDKNSYLPIRDFVFCDIGDSQSLTSSLSTFSGHMTNVLSIFRQLTPDSLILLDELGSGTDPTEGMGIAVAMLEALRQSGCFFMATTHYPEVKTYVHRADGVLSARMAFDQETLRPLYRLEIGKTGKSCALEIARRLGMPEQILQCAKQIVSNGVDGLKNQDRFSFEHRRGKLKRKPAPSTQNISTFQMGDSVLVLPQRVHGIVYQPADEKGDVIVQIKNIKQPIRHTRLQLLIPASELYPDDYDFSIIFDTVENRKARHTLSRKYDAEAIIVHKEGN